MTVETTLARVVHTGNGATTLFSFAGVTYFEPAEISVTLVATDGVETLLTSPAGYTISGNNATLAVAPASGVAVVIQRTVALTQPDVLRNNAPLPAAVLEERLDRIVLGLQQINDGLERAAVLPASSVLDGVTIPEPEAGKFLRGNVAEDGFENAEFVATGVLALPLGLAQGGTGGTSAGTARAALSVPSIADLDAEEAARIAADAAEVAARTAAITALNPLRRGFRAGLGVTLNTTDDDHDVDVAEGVAAADASPWTPMVLSAITKRLDAAWAVGNGNGGLDTGAIAADTAYYGYVIRRPDTGITDFLWSANAFTPVMPTNYTERTRVAIAVTDGSANLLFVRALGAGEFLSGLNALTAAALLTITHGLGATPRRVNVLLMNYTAEQNYTPGMLLDPGAFNFTNSGAQHTGYVTQAGPTTALLRFQATSPVLILPNWTTGATFALTATSWRLLVGASL